MEHLTSLADGGFVVAWVSKGQDGDGYGVYGQVYSDDGTRVGSEFRVNTYTVDDQYIGTITSLVDGGFVVTWGSVGQDSVGQDAESVGVYGQVFDGDGRPVGSEFRVNTYTTANQVGQRTTSLADGGFVVTWSSVGQDGDGYGVYGQVYNDDGTRVGSEFRVNTYTAGNQEVRSAMSLADGGFVAIWDSYYGQDGDGFGVYGQVFDGDGNRSGSEFRVNTYTTGTQSSPSITSLADSGFVVTWSSYFGQDGDGSRVYGQLFSSNGNSLPSGSVTIVGTARQDQTLTANISDIADADGINTATIAYEWLRDGSAISDAAGSSYMLTQADVGRNISLRYSYNDNAGTAESVTSAATAAVQNVNDIPIGSVSISGQVKVGSTLSANSASLSDADGLGVLSYQWLRDGETISQATSSAYRITADDYRHQISVRVTYTDDFGQNESVTSTETVSVGPTHNGTTGSDVITGTAESDVITGLAGNDWIFGTGGNDALYGGAGNDTIDDGTGDDTIDGGSGVDTLKRDYAFATDYSLTLEINLKSGTTSSPNFPEENPDILISIENLIVTGRCSFVLTGSDVANMLNSSTGNDFLSGNGGNDTLNGGGGSDTMIGGYGDDYFITNGADTILESVGQGTDTVESTVNYSLGDNIENLILAGTRAVDGTGNALGNNVTGNGEANLLRGMAGNDTVSGMSGNDTLDGSSGRDILSGGKGNDRIIGGSGADVFVFNRGDGTDTVTDFVNGLDVLQIANGAEKFADITVLDSGLNVTISFANVKVTLLNLNHSSIDASDFAFV